MPAPVNEEPRTEPEPSCRFAGGSVMDFVPENLVIADGDPLAGRFTLRQATQGLHGTGSLFADIETNHGTLTCELWHEQAPYTVANFVGLARGLRPFLDPNKQIWQSRPAYDGSSFHRVIADFMIQGGDPTNRGQGDPGYVIPDEIWEGSAHDRAGLLCMANRGPNTNGMQFFILHDEAPHLDGSHSIFGSCGPMSVIDEIASVPVGYGGAPAKPVEIRSVRIEVEGPCP